MNVISESDWKLFSRFRAIALERFCERTLKDIGPIVSQQEQSWHERYLAVCKLITESDDDLAKVFNDFRRSTAYFQLSKMSATSLLTDEEIAQFSPAAREWATGKFLR